MCGYIYMGIHTEYDSFILNLTLVRSVDPKALFPNKVLGTINSSMEDYTQVLLQKYNKWGLNGDRGNVTKESKFTPIGCQRNLPFSVDWRF